MTAFARALRPVHTPVDGDVVFALSTGAKPLIEPWQFHLGRIGSIAADCLARAVARGVFAAAPLGRFPAYRDVHKAGLCSARVDAHFRVETAGLMPVIKRTLPALTPSVVSV